jgi:uncharacterized membrane protein
MIAVGVRVNRPGLVNTAMVFVVLDIVARYFDFFSMMDRSLFFVLGSLVLMVGGALVEKSRRRPVNKAA